MKLLKSWIEDYIKLEMPDDKLADAINFSGTEVEDIIQKLDDKVIVAEILEVKPHPNADRLRLAKVNTGTETVDIVCGAPNIKPGQKVPLAQIGAKLGDFEIKEAVIRGEKSFGMLCAEGELGLGTDHEGIMILPAEAKVGVQLSEIITSDTILDLKPTPNRGDNFSHFGMAREIGASLGQKVNLPEITVEPEGSSDLNITIGNGDDCERYVGAYITGVKIAESPQWLKDRLIACGAKPISNIVDITNYVMLDLGQPLHAFDAKKIDNFEIIVRRAENLEDLITLDGEIRHLSPDNLVIADKNKALAIAGVMGGQNSEISASTTEIVLESAYFSPTLIRKSSKRLNLQTEASYRFERRVDPKITELALKKAVKLILELAGGKLIDIKETVAKKFQERKIKIEYAKINDLLGLRLTEKEIDSYLGNLGFEISEGSAFVPSWRGDVSLWQDLAEEVARLYGLNNIPHCELPELQEMPDVSEYNKKEFIKDILVENGFSEVATYSPISEQDVKESGLDTENLLELANPVQPENKYLRNTLIPGLLRSIAKNPTFDPILIFEMGNVFTKESEDSHLAIAASGKNSKKMLENAIADIETKLKFKFDQSITDLPRDDLNRYKIRKPVTYFIELDLAKLLSQANFEGLDLSLKITEKPIHYRSLSKFPSLTRDLAFILSDQTDADIVADTIYNVSALVNRVELFDEFVSDRFGQGKKNIAFHLYMQKMDRTLTDQEADTEIRKIIEEVENKYQAKLRSN